MTYYDMTNCSSVETFKGFLECPNSLTAGGFWMMMWVSIVCVTFLIIKSMRLENDHALAGSGLIGFFSAAFLFWMGLIGWQVMLGSVVLLIISGIWITVNNSVEY